MANQTTDVYTPYAFESKTVSSTALKLASSVYATGAAEPVLARVSAANDALYYRLEGAPATSGSHLLPVNTNLDIYGAAAIRNASFLRVTNDAVISVTYFKREN